ncbi:urease accessory protein UreE [Komagataeibacter nataicola NRIC 0616]|nr:urease accessory protein UreE [Komagataeibacter nataicola NRIC 0616]
MAEAADVFAADYEGRHRRRMMLALRSGARVLLELEHARLLADGDGLVLDDGRIVRVEALPEDLMEVTAHDPLHLLRLAWHLGNRHLPATITAQRILVRHDHVIADMIAGLGGQVRRVQAAFDPESGAYAGRGVSHDHDHAHPHAHGGHVHSHG